MMVASLLMLCIWLLHLRRQSDMLSESLVAAVDAVSKDAHQRPTHVAPALPRSFGDALAPHLQRLRSIRKKLGVLPPKDSDGLLQAIAWGERPVQDLPPVWQAMLRESREARHQILLATHTSSARAPQHLRPLAGAAPAEKDLEEESMSLLLVGWLTAFEIRQHLHDSQREAAVDRCVDALTLGRDLGHNGLLARVLGHGIVRSILRSCEAAFDGASTPLKERGLQQLAAIRQAMSAPAEGIRETVISIEIDMFGRLLSPERQARLPPEGRAMVGTSLGRWDSLRLQRFWPRFVRVHARMGLTWELPAAERNRRQEEILRGAEDLWHLLEQTTDYLRRGDDCQRATITRLEVLRAAVHVDLFHARNHRWPERLAEALPAGIQLIDARTGKPVTLSPAGNIVQAQCERWCGADSSVIQAVLQPDPGERAWHPGPVVLP
jgi:hypothetical protein